MSLTVTFDSHGIDRVDFFKLRERLLAEGGKFDERTIMQVPYEELSLCVMANAGSAACDLDLVRAEKQQRRERFLDMSPDTFPSMKRYLQAQGMWEDVLTARHMRYAKPWEGLSLLQKTWLKLTCLHNHIDDPGDRLRHIENLLFKAGDFGILPLYTASKFVDLIAQLITFYPSEINADDFRMYIGSYAEEILQLMVEDEREVCAQEMILDFQCTSDCFQPTLSLCNS